MLNGLLCLIDYSVTKSNDLIYFIIRTIRISLIFIHQIDFLLKIDTHCKKNQEKYINKNKILFSICNTMTGEIMRNLIFFIEVKEYVQIVAEISFICFNHIFITFHGAVPLFP